MAAPLPPDFWQTLATLHHACSVKVVSSYPVNDQGVPSLTWTITLTRLPGGDAQEQIEVADRSMFAALLAAMDQARTRGWIR